MMKKLLPILGLSALILFFNSCEPREEAKDPTADFTYSPANDIQVGDIVTFTNTSLDYTDALWDFGDGSNTSEVPNPTHIYDEPGTYNVTLIVENKGKKDQATKTITVEAGVTACFDLSPNPAETYEPVYFTNCSEGADSYEWDMNNDGEIDSTDEEPVFEFYEAGVYTVKLIAYSGTSSDETTKTLTIEEGGGGSIDPYVYDLGSIWFEYYVNLFDDDNGDFTTGSDSDWMAEITDSEYIITNFSSETAWFFWTNSIGMPSADESYDLEILFKLNYDDVTQGQGLFWGLDNSNWDYYYYRWSIVGSDGYYTIGDKNMGSWLESPGWLLGGDVGEYNLISVRKYLDRYYFFMNGDFIFEEAYGGDFGEKFGFFVGASSQMSSAFISIYTMNVGNKKANAGAKTYEAYMPDNIKQRSGGVKAFKNVDKMK